MDPSHRRSLVCPWSSLPRTTWRDPSVLVGLVDTGADATLVPIQFLQTIEAEEIYRAYLRSHWGERRSIAIYLVDLEVAGHVLPGIEVIGDALSDDVLLGRNVLNRLILLLDGPAGNADILTKPPRQ